MPIWKNLQSVGILMHGSVRLEKTTDNPFESMPGFINLVRFEARWSNDISSASSWKTRNQKEVTRAEFLLWQQGYLFTLPPLPSSNFSFATLTLSTIPFV